MFKFLLASVIALAAIGFLANNDNSPASGKTLSLDDVRGKVTDTAAKAAAADNATNPRSKNIVLSNLNIELVKWARGGFGTVMIADFKITNNNDFDVKDLVVKCDHFAASGTRIDSNTGTVYELFPAKKNRSVKEFNMGRIHPQAESSGCVVIGFSLAD